MSTRRTVFKAVADFSALSRAARKSKTEVKDLGSATVKSATKMSVALEKVAGSHKAVARSAAVASTASSKVAASARLVATNSATATRAQTLYKKALNKTSVSSNTATTSSNRLSTALAKVSHSTALANGGILGFAQNIGLAKVGLAGLAVGVGALIAGLATIGVVSAAGMEQTHVAFTNILGSSQEAETVINRIIAMARDTPFSTDVLLVNVKQMLAAGFKMEEILSGVGHEAEGLSIVIGDSVAAMGGGTEAVNGITRAFVRMKATGKVTMEELRLLMERGIPALEILKDELGLTDKQLQNIGDSGVTADEAINALSTGLTNRFGGAMEAQSKTLKGLLNTLKDNALIALRNAFMGVFNAIKPVVQVVGELMTAINVGAEDIGLIEAMKRNMPLIAPLIDGVVRSFQALNTIVRELSPAIRVMLAAFGGTALAAASVALQGIAAALEVLAALLSAVPDDVMMLIGAFASLAIIGVKVKKLFLALSFAKAITGMQNMVAGVQLYGAAFLAAGPAVWLMVGAVAALSAAFLWSRKSARDAREANLTFHESAEAVADSMFVATGETDEFGNQVLKLAEDVFVANEDIQALSKSLLELSPDASREKIIAWGQDLQASGVIAEDVVKIMNELSNFTFGEGGELFDLGDLDSTTARANSLLGVLGEFELAMDRMGGGDVRAEYFLPRAVSTESIEDLQHYSASLAIVAQQDVSGVIGSFQALNAEMSNNSPEVQAAMWTVLGQSLAEAMGMSDMANGSFTSMADVMDMLAGETSGLSAEQRALAALYGSDGGSRQASVAREDLRVKTEALSNATDAAAEAEIDLTDAISAGAEAGAEYAEVVESWAKALGAFIDPVGIYKDLLSEVTDEQKAVAESAAVAAGVGAKNWEMFSGEAGVSLDDWMTGLQEAGAAQERWSGNMTDLATRLGADHPLVAMLRDAGPELAGMAEQLVQLADDELNEFGADLPTTLSEGGMQDAALEMTAVTTDIIDNLVTGLEDGEELTAAAATALTDGVIGELGLMPGQAQTLVNLVNAELQKIGQGVVVRIPGLPVPAGPGSSRGSSYYEPVPVRSSGGNPNDPRPTERADGGIDNLPGSAKIHRGKQLIQWAEPETGGEAFIPLAVSKRDQSIRIWQETGRLLGAIAFADGGFREGDSSTGRISNRAPDISQKGSTTVITFNAETLKDAIERAYKNILGRDSDAGGSEYWAGQFTDGLRSMDEIRQAIFDSKEGAGRFSSMFQSPGDIAVPIVAKPAREEDEKDDAYLERYNKLVEEVTQNVWDFNFAQSSSGKQVQMLNAKMAEAQPFSAAWTAMLSKRDSVIDSQRQMVDTAFSDLSGLFEQETQIRGSIATLQANYAAAQVKLENDKNNAIVNANTQLASALEKLTSARFKREASLSKNLAKQVESITEQHGDRIENLTESKNKRVASLNKQNAKREKGLAKGLADQLANIAEQRNDSLAAEDERFADLMDSQTDALMSSMNPMDAYQAKWANTTAAIIANTRKQNAAFTETQQGLADLKSRGLGQDAIDLLGLADPANASQVSKLLGSTDAQLKTINELMAQRRATARKQVIASSGDAKAEVAKNKAEVIKDAQEAMREAQEAYNESLAESRANFSETMTEVLSSFNESVADAATSRDESLADARENFNESMAELAADFAEQEQDLLSSHADTLAEIETEFTQTMSELGTDFTNEMASLEAELAAIGQSSGMTFAEAIAKGLESGIPGIRAAAERLKKELDILNALNEMPTPGLPTQDDPQLPTTPSGEGEGSEGGNSYTIVSGDSWWKMAQKLWGDGRRFAELAAMNGSDVSKVIHPGQVIKYHGGGVAGEQRPNEMLAMLERGEGIISTQAMAGLNDGAGNGLGGQINELHLSIELDGEVVYKSVKTRERRDDFGHDLSGGDL